MYITEKTKWTFRELLMEFDIKELWYIISLLYNLPPLRIEKLYKFYLDARIEMLDLPIINDNANVLYCELFINEDNGGAPEVSFKSTIVCAEDTERHDFKLTDWTELVDCEVDYDCLLKYGALIVTAELLWEMTFCGFDRKSVIKRAKAVEDMVDDSKTECSKLAQGVFDEDKDYVRQGKNFQKRLEAATKEWFINAPEIVKREIFEMLKVAALHELNDDVDDEEFVKTIRARLGESTYKHKNYENDAQLFLAYKYKSYKNAAHLLYPMFNSLDYDDMLCLAELLQI